MKDPTMTRLVDAPPTLEEAHKIVGGYVEMITLPNGDQMLVDEDGWPKRLMPNVRACEIAERIIVGNALILTGKARWLG